MHQLNEPCPPYRDTEFTHVFRRMYPRHLLEQTHRVDNLLGLLDIQIPRSSSSSSLILLGRVLLAYSGIGIVGIHQTIVRSRVTLIPEWL